MPLHILPAAQQSPGGFDNGRITERRPVLFVNRGADTERIGPLFYWAWAVAESGGFIAEHPHQAFEIVSYVITGTIEHRDSLGTWKSLEAGGLQVMQTNSGVSHSERFAEGIRSEMFQIWFEPDLRETLTLPPTYSDYPADAFVWINAGGNKIQHIAGDDAPATLRTDAHMHEIILRPKGSLRLTKNDVHIVLLAISGEGTITLGNERGTLTKGDAAIVTPDVDQVLTTSCGEAEFRYAQIMVPVRTPYPLYPNL